MIPRRCLHLGRPKAGLAPDLRRGAGRRRRRLRAPGDVARGAGVARRGRGWHWGARHSKRDGLMIGWLREVPRLEAFKDVFRSSYENLYMNLYAYLVVRDRSILGIHIPLYGSIYGSQGARLRVSQDDDDPFCELNLMQSWYRILRTIRVE